ncbi:MAG: DUF3822 family protein [Paludibacter sp.]|nr:DUF3822 family protein [Paludibacter sp.]
MEQNTTSTNNNLYSLSIRISSDGFSLSVFDESKLLLTFKKINISFGKLSIIEIVEIIKKETQLYYRNINLIYESDIYAIIPDSIFKPENASDFLYLQHEPVKNDQIISNSIPTWGVVNTFTIPDSIQNALHQVFPYTTIQHHLSFFLTDNIKMQSADCLYIWTRHKMMDIVVIKNGKLQLINSFSYQTPEDFAYFTLNVFEQLMLDIENCKVYLFNAETKTNIKKTLEEYLSVISSQ